MKKKELETVINYLMKENIKLKDELNQLKDARFVGKNDTGTVFDKIIAETLYLSGKVSDGVILETHGDWEKVNGV